MTIYSAISRNMRTIHNIGYMYALHAWLEQRFNAFYQRG
jgi:hypothetical protein